MFVEEVQLYKACIAELNKMMQVMHPECEDTVAQLQQLQEDKVIFQRRLQLVQAALAVLVL